MMRGVKICAFLAVLVLTGLNNSYPMDNNLIYQTPYMLFPAAKYIDYSFERNLDKLLDFMGFSEEYKSIIKTKIQPLERSGIYYAWELNPDYRFEKKHHSKALGELWAGKAIVDITPPLGCPSAGYGGRVGIDLDPTHDPYDYATIYKPMLGVHDRLEARILVLDDGNKRICIASLDAIGISGKIHPDICAKIGSTGINEDNFIMCGSHTHSGPGALSTTPFWMFCTVDFFKQEIYDQMVDKIAKGIIQAADEANMERVTFGVGRGIVNGLTENKRNDPILDNECAVFRFDKYSDGSPFATIFLFNIHGTSLSDDNLYFSSECMGGAVRYIDQNLGGMSMFINGCEADTAPAYGGWSGIKYIGEQLGSAVINIRNTIPTTDTVNLKYSSNVYRFPMPYIRPGLEVPQIPLWVTIPLVGLFEDEARFQAFRINDTLIGTMPGEALAIIGLNIKNRFRNGALYYGRNYPDTYIFGLANYFLSYFTNTEEYWQGGYQAIATFFGPETGDMVTGFCVDTLEDVID